MQELGFSNVSRQPRIIYIAKNGASLWHFWRIEKQEVEPIDATSISGYLRSIETIVTVSEKYGTSEKLRLLLDVGDRSYYLQSGLDSWFSKTSIRALGCLSKQQLLKSIAIEPYSTDNSSKVIFTRIYDCNNNRIYSGDRYPFKKDSKGNSIDDLDYRKVIAEIKSRLPVEEEFEDAVAEIASATPAVRPDSVTNPDTGEVEGIDLSELVF